MEERVERDLLLLFNALDKANISNNLVQKEFCGTLLNEYIKDGIDIYSLVDKTYYEPLVKEGLNLFNKRKIKFYRKKKIFTVFLALLLALFAKVYLRATLLMAIAFFVIGYILENLIKSKINNILFVSDTKKEYSIYVSKEVLYIRESEDASRLWR